MRDWFDWHTPYADADSPLSRRLRLVQGHISTWLDARPDPELTVASICAGQGRDILDVLTARSDANRVRAHLFEYDPRNVAVAQDTVSRNGLTGVTVVRADAGRLECYAGAVPADLLLLVGVLGNISDADAETTIRALPQLCAANATVIWTRSRRPPDRTGVIREWFAATGFVERAFDAPADAVFSVGVQQFAGQPESLGSGQMFRFL